jgi:hypothetical protein
MGVYLSEPNKEKHTIHEKGTRMDYVCAEMQGKGTNMQAGGRPWRMQPFTSST